MDSGLGWPVAWLSFGVGEQSTFEPRRKYMATLGVSIPLIVSKCWVWTRVFGVALAYLPAQQPSSLAVACLVGAVLC